MRFLWWNITRITGDVDVPEPSPLDALKDACDEMTTAWNNMPDRKTRPWINWDERKIMLTRWEGVPVVIYEGKSADG